MAQKNHAVTAVNHPDLWQALLPELTPASHKYSRGYTLIVGGYPVTGAARLAALAAARIGSGLTALLVPEIAFAIYASALTSIMVRTYQNSHAFDAGIADPRINCYLIGPGAGVNAQTQAALFALLSRQKPVVIDADALTVCQNQLGLLASAIKSPCVLTPHAGEFKQLFKLDESNRVLSVQRAAASCGAVVVLKGSETIIAAPDGQTIINPVAPATLATGGSGDVLAGMIASARHPGYRRLWRCISGHDRRFNGARHGAIVRCCRCRLDTRGGSQALWAGANRRRFTLIDSPGVTAIGTGALARTINAPLTLNIGLNFG